VVVYLVECAHHVSREIVAAFRDQEVHLIGFSGCYPNAYALRMLQQLCTHPNVGGALLVSLGCESMDRKTLANTIEQSGRPVHTLVIQREGARAKRLKWGAPGLQVLWKR
jgi:altronate hydrolase